MILHPNILALFVSSLLTASMVLYSAGFGLEIVRRWDLASGSERQLALERRTYLISTVVSYFLFFQLVSLFLFVWTADSICDLFVGAMCAVGTLTVNGFGYPTLVLKIVNFVLAGLWLILNHADRQGWDYPLIRVKYLLLAILAPLLLVETLLQSFFFFRLTPDIITSCCGSLFSPNARGIATEIANAPPLAMLFVFYACALLTLGAGVVFLHTRRAGYLFALLSGVNFLVALVSVVSVVSLYIYQMPSHHCPFCILQGEYYYIGYPIYLSLLTAAVAGLGVGVLMPFRGEASLKQTLPLLQRRLTAVSLSAHCVFLLLCSGPIVFTSFSPIFR